MQVNNVYYRESLSYLFLQSSIFFFEVVTMKLTKELFEVFHAEFLELFKNVKFDSKSDEMMLLTEYCEYRLWQMENMA